MSLVIDHLSATYGTRRVLHDVSATFAAGAVIALAGPNGAGKSSLLKILAGLIRPAAGTITLDATPLYAATTAGRATPQTARRIAYLPQDRAIHWPLAVRAIVALGRLPHQSAGTTTAARDTAAVDAALSQMDIAAFADRPVLALSGGEQARVLMARALAQEPRVLLADEPTAGLDMAHQLDLMASLRARAHQGMTSIVALHDLSLAARYADCVLLLAGGRLIAAGAPADVLTAKCIGAVYGVDMVIADVGGVRMFAPRRKV